MTTGVGTAGRRPLLFDASVLIDYDNADRRIVTLISEHLGPAIVPSPVLEEVDGWTDTLCEQLGLRVVEPTTQQILQTTDPPQNLSWQDHICFLLSKDYGWTCVTNDASLRNACLQAGVLTIRGLRPLIELVRMGQMDRATAVNLAQRIHEANPYHISSSIVERFVNELSLS